MVITNHDELEHGPVALAERVLETLFEHSPPPVVVDTALDVAKALLPYRHAKRRQEHLTRTGQE